MNNYKTNLLNVNVKMYLLYNCFKNNLAHTTLTVLVNTQNKELLENTDMLPKIQESLQWRLYK